MKGISFLEAQECPAVYILLRIGNHLYLHVTELQFFCHWYR
jgi:hypothetical protein